MRLSRLFSRSRQPSQSSEYLDDPVAHAAAAPPRRPSAPAPPPPHPHPPPYHPPRRATEPTPASAPRQRRLQPEPEPDPTSETDLPAYSTAVDHPPATRGIHSLPTAVLHHILRLTLDPKATPDRFAFDEDIERVHRLHSVFRLRGVDRRFFLLCTSLLRTHFEPVYRSLLVGSTGLPSHLGGRERAVFDRFVALRIGEDVRRAESSLTEDTGEERDIFHRLQPAARLEDMLLTLPPGLVRATSPALVLPEFPIPQPCLSIKLTPGWAQVYFTEPGRARSLLVEVRRGRGDDTIERIEAGLEAVRNGYAAWGERVG